MPYSTTRPHAEFNKRPRLFASSEMQAGRVRDASGTRAECIREVCRTRSRRVSDAFERYLGPELYRISLLYIFFMVNPSTSIIQKAGFDKTQMKNTSRKLTMLHAYPVYSVKKAYFEMRLSILLEVVFSY